MKVFNTLSGREEEFVPQGDVVKMYVCGVTPYAECHVGHAMSYIVFDVVRRYLEFKGYKVRHIQNFTDIDDKIIDRARQTGITPADLAEKYISSYFACADKLNISRAHVYPRATGEIDKIVEVIEGLVRKGHAYEGNGSVYFRVTSDPDYGKLSRQSLEALQVGARVEVNSGKEHPLDFTLWKAAKPGEPSWNSPWGPGRPGWHIECSAMSLRYLGETLDIHGGGQDLIFPHHENEIAQSESFTGAVPFVRYWMHNGLVQLGGEKMSKSLGVLVSIQEVLERYSPDALRMFILSSHYRSPLSFSEEGLEAAERGMERLRQAACGSAGGTSQDGQPMETGEFRQRFMAAMDADFNTAQALAALFDLAREINRCVIQGARVEEGQQTLVELGSVLGFTFKKNEVELAPEPFIELLISIRAELRRERRWEMADRVRAGLKELGVVLEDTPQKTTWKYEKPS